MKTLASLSLVSLFAIVPLQLSLVQAQQSQVGNIGGEVVDRTEKDGSRKREMTMMVTKPEKPGEASVIDEVTLKLPELSEAARKGIIFIPLTPNWDVTWKGWDVTFSGPATDTFRAVGSLTQDAANALKDVTYEFGFGGRNLGIKTFEVKYADPVKPVKPTDAATFPKDLFIGGNFTFNPKDGYTDAKGWRFDVGDIKLGASPALSSDDFKAVGPTEEELKNEFKKQYGRQPSKAEITQGALLNIELQQLMVNLPRNVKTPPDGKIWAENKDDFGNIRVKGPIEGTTVYPDPFNGGPPPPPQLISCTPKIFPGGEVCVCGIFPSEFERGQLMLDGKRIGTPSTSSPGMVTFTTTKDILPREHEITFDKSAFTSGPGITIRVPPTGKDKVKFVVLNPIPSLDRNKLFTGDGTTLRIKVEGTKEKVRIKLENLTPSIIEMKSGEFETSGGDNNVLNQNVKGIKQGEFDIRYELSVGPCPCNPADLKKLGGAVTGEVAETPGSSPTGNTPPGNPTPDQSAVRRVDCELILAGCKSVEKELKRLEYLYRQARADCQRTDNPEVKQKCLDIQRDKFEPRIAAAKGQLFACLGRYQECAKSTGEPTKVASTPPDTSKQTSNPDEDCSKIRAECKGWQEAIDNTRQQVEKSLLYCEEQALKEYPEDVDKRRSYAEKCKAEARDEENGTYSRDFKYFKGKLDDCQKRLAACVTKQHPLSTPPSVNGPTTNGTSQAAAPVNPCLQIRAEYNELNKKLLSLQEEKAKAEDACNYNKDCLDRVFDAYYSRYKEAFDAVSSCSRRYYDCAFPVQPR
jgi:hypothetical protein